MAMFVFGEGYLSWFGFGVEYAMSVQYGVVHAPRVECYGVNSRVPIGFRVGLLVQAW